MRKAEFDTVYVAVPNILHYEVVKKSLEYGKNVICEKPFTNNLKELEELYSLAKEKNLVLIEAITNQYLPNYKKVKENISKLGDIRLVESNYSQYSSRLEAFKNGIIAPAFDKSKGGGSLADINIYNIHICVGLFGVPQDVKYYPNFVNGVDTSGVLILDYFDHKALCIAAKDTVDNSYTHIQGDKGKITIIGPANSVESYSINIRNGGSIENINDNIHPHRMYSEFVEFIDIIHNKKMDLVEEKMIHCMNVMRVLDLARKSEEEYLTKMV